MSNHRARETQRTIISYTIEEPNVICLDKNESAAQSGGMGNLISYSEQSTQEPSSQGHSPSMFPSQEPTENDELLGNVENEEQLIACLEIDDKETQKDTDDKVAFVRNKSRLSLGKKRRPSIEQKDDSTCDDDMEQKKPKKLRVKEENGNSNVTVKEEDNMECDSSVDNPPLTSRVMISLQRSYNVCSHKVCRNLLQVERMNLYFAPHFISPVFYTQIIVNKFERHRRRLFAAQLRHRHILPARDPIAPAQPAANTLRPDLRARRGSVLRRSARTGQASKVQVNKNDEDVFKDFENFEDLLQTSKAPPNHTIKVGEEAAISSSKNTDKDVGFCEPPTAPNPSRDLGRTNDDDDVVIETTHMSALKDTTWKRVRRVFGSESPSPVKATLNPKQRRKILHECSSDEETPKFSFQTPEQKTALVSQNRRTASKDEPMNSDHVPKNSDRTSINSDNAPTASNHEPTVFEDNPPISQDNPPIFDHAPMPSKKKLITFDLESMISEDKAAVSEDNSKDPWIHVWNNAKRQRTLKETSTKVAEQKPTDFEETTTMCEEWPIISGDQAGLNEDNPTSSEAIWLNATKNRTRTKRQLTSEETSTEVHEDESILFETNPTSSEANLISSEANPKSSEKNRSTKRRAKKETSTKFREDEPTISVESPTEEDQVELISSSVENASLETTMAHHECPMCFKMFPRDKIEAHAANCNGEIPTKPLTKERPLYAGKSVLRTPELVIEESKSEKAANVENDAQMSPVIKVRTPTKVRELKVLEASVTVRNLAEEFSTPQGPGAYLEMFGVNILSSPELSNAGKRLREKQRGKSSPATITKPTKKITAGDTSANTKTKNASRMEQRVEESGRKGKYVGKDMGKPQQQQQQPETSTTTSPKVGKAARRSGKLGSETGSGNEAGKQRNIPDVNRRSPRSLQKHHVRSENESTTRPFPSVLEKDFLPLNVVDPEREIQDDPGDDHEMDDAAVLQINIVESSSDEENVPEPRDIKEMDDDLAALDFMSRAYKGTKRKTTRNTKSSKRSRVSSCPEDQGVEQCAFCSKFIATAEYAQHVVKELQQRKMKVNGGQVPIASSSTINSSLRSRHSSSETSAHGFNPAAETEPQIQTTAAADDQDSPLKTYTPINQASHSNYFNQFAFGSANSGGNSGGKRNSRRRKKCRGAKRKSGKRQNLEN